LELACGAAKNKFGHLKTIVGIAIDAPKFGHFNSEDFILMDCKEWPDARRAMYEEANEGFRFFNTDKLVMTKRQVTEFPHLGVSLPKTSKRSKAGRNDACPCGSGKKYKKCCLT
jgi:uncharacterized protein YecA (UPF0149 family)